MNELEWGTECSGDFVLKDGSSWRYLDSLAEYLIERSRGGWCPLPARRLWERLIKACRKEDAPCFRSLMRDL